MPSPRTGATYVLGDLHGCFDTLRELLPRLPFDPGRDRLWLAGDLFNRGPRALESLRWARRMAESLGERFRCVLGNHDLHLLRRAAGLRPARPRDTLEPILAAPEGDELVEWVASLPLLHREPAGGAHRPSDRDTLLVHAGLWPTWTAGDAEGWARRVEALLRDPATRRGVLEVPPDLPLRAPGGPGAGLDAARRALYGFTELRTLGPGGNADDDFSGAPEEAPPGRVPWFRAPDRPTAGALVVFGHWSALGFHRGDGVLGVDTGAVWGGGLTAVRLEDGERWFQPTVERPGELPSRS